MMLINKIEFHPTCVNEISIAAIISIPYKNSNIDKV